MPPARPSRSPRRSRHSPDIEQLMHLARALAQSSSRIEDGFWETRLAALIDKLIGNADDASLDTALDSLGQADPRACDALADVIEFRCESRIDNVEATRDVLLFAAPLLVWSRYAIPSGAINVDLMKNMRVQLLAHVFAANVRIGLADVLFSPDQLPQSFSDTARLKDKLIKAALHSRDLHMDDKHLGETINFLSDNRYVVGVAIAEKGTAVFRWQEADATAATRDAALSRWREQGGEVLRPMLPACASELLLPLAFHSACREADRQSRPYSIRASVAFLNTAVNIAASQLRAVVAPFQENRIEEYRIGFVHKDSGDVVHGIVWPLLDADENSETTTHIEAVLHECGITDVRIVEHTFPLEYCDDCGAPLYPNNEDEAVHAELPEEDGSAMPQHLH